MIRIDPFRACRVERIRVHEASNPLRIRLDCIRILFNPRVLRIDHQRGKPNPRDAARVTNDFRGVSHAVWKLIIRAPVAIHLLVTIINLNHTFTEGVGVVIDCLSHIQNMRFVDFGRAVIPTAPTINRAFVTMNAVRDSHPARP